ncbi:invasin, partial [Citrobacter sp. Igbk 16]|nr:invasin [Citrobacter sp. Igbk 16]
ANATLKAGSSWKDNGDGTYMATYTATTVGTDLKATLQLSGWGSPSSSETYVIHDAAALKNISVNGYTFASNAGFPTTGFKGAEFRLELSNASATDYDWKADANWVAVTDGVVSFTGTGTKDKVTITGTPKGGGTAITYSFTLSSWYINAGGRLMKWPDAAAYCSQSGYSLPTVQQLNGNGVGIRDAPGGLWSEWGRLSNYNGASFYNSNYWSSEQENSDTHYLVYLGTGYVISNYDNYNNSVVCRQGL